MGSTPQNVTFTPDQQRFIEHLIRQVRPRGKPGYGLVSFALEDVQPPSTEYLTRDANLQINIFPVGTTNTVTVALKIMTPDGKLNVSQFIYTNFTTLTKFQDIKQLAEGFLLSITVTISGAATIHRGDTFVQIGVQEGPGASTPMYRILISGYVTSTASLAWPEGNLLDSVSGSGLLISQALANPAAGADFTFTFNANSRSWLHAFTATLTTSSTAANRTPVFYLKDSGGNAIWSLGSSAAQVASKALEYNLGEAATVTVDATGNYVITMPSEVYMYGAWTLSSTTANIQAADQWSAIRALFEQWVEI